jgi:hypothetical protein
MQMQMRTDKAVTVKCHYRASGDRRLLTIIRMRKPNRFEETEAFERRHFAGPRRYRFADKSTLPNPAAPCRERSNESNLRGYCMRCGAAPFESCPEKQ